MPADWETLERELDQGVHQMEPTPRAVRSLESFRELEPYFRQMGIRLNRTRGPYYLAKCYDLYRTRGVEPSPDMLAVTALAFGGRVFQVRRALYLLRKKLERQDPQAAARQGEGLYRFLDWLFGEIRERGA